MNGDKSRGESVQYLKHVLGVIASPLNYTYRGIWDAWQKQIQRQALEDIANNPEIEKYFQRSEAELGEIPSEQ